MRLIFLIVVTIGLASCKTKQVSKASIDDIGYIAEFQQYMLNEINFVRSHPAVYAELRLIENKNRLTDNGSYEYLMRIIPSGTLTINNILQRSALKYANLLAQKQLFSSDADGTPYSRALRNDYPGKLVAENIAAYSEKEFDAKLDPRTAAVNFVKLLIIDKSVSNFGHRITLLNPEFTTVGIGYCQDTTGRHVNYIVQDFGDF